MTAFNRATAPDPTNELTVYDPTSVPSFSVLDWTDEFSDAYDIAPIQKRFRPTYRPGTTDVKTTSSADGQYQKRLAKYRPSVKICPTIGRRISGLRRLP